MRDERANADQGAKRCGCRINLIVMGAVGKRAQFLDESTIQSGLDHPDEAVLTLRSKPISTIYLGAFFTFGRNSVALQQAH
jgi:hypothetical protein